MIRTCKTQCKVDCCGPFSKLFIRLSDPARSADPNTRFIAIDLVESITTNECTGEAKYVFTYDENDLNDPTDLLTVDEYFIICVNADHEYTVEQIEAIVAPVIEPVDSNCIDLIVSGDNGHTLQADLIVDPAADNALSCGASGAYVPGVDIESDNGGDVTKGVGADYAIKEITETSPNQFNILGAAEHSTIFSDVEYEDASVTDPGDLVAGATVNGFAGLSNSITNTTNRVMLVEEIYSILEYGIITTAFTGLGRLKMDITSQRNQDGGSFVALPWNSQGFEIKDFDMTDGYYTENKGGPTYFKVHTLNPGDTLTVVYANDLALGASNNIPVSSVNLKHQSLLKGFTV